MKLKPDHFCCAAVLFLTAACPVWAKALSDMGDPAAVRVIVRGKTYPSCAAYRSSLNKQDRVAVVVAVLNVARSGVNTYIDDNGWKTMVVDPAMAGIMGLSRENASGKEYVVSRPVRSVKELNEGLRQAAEKSQGPLLVVAQGNTVRLLELTHTLPETSPDAGRSAGNGDCLRSDQSDSSVSSAEQTR